MTPSINAVGFTLDQKQSDMIDTKLKRISYADDLIVDLIMRIKHDKEYSFDTTVNFRWGAQAHVTGLDYALGWQCAWGYGSQAAFDLVYGYADGGIG